MRPSLRAGTVGVYGSHRLAKLNVLPESFSGHAVLELHRSVSRTCDFCDTQPSTMVIRLGRRDRNLRAYLWICLFPHEPNAFSLMNSAPLPATRQSTPKQFDTPLGFLNLQHV